MEKKILGYLAPYDLWQGDVKKNTFYKGVTDSDGKNYGISTNLDNESFYMPAEIVEKWQPVYEKDVEYKVGDWVVFDPSLYGEESMTSFWDRVMVLRVDTVINKSLRFNVEQLYFHPFFKTVSDISDGTYCSNSAKYFRIATPAEIKLASHLIYKANDYVMCTKEINILGGIPEFKVGCIYQCIDNRRIRNNKGEEHGITSDCGFDHFRFASKQEIESFGLVNLFFGDVNFKIKAKEGIAYTQYGVIPKEEIIAAINYIENPPKLAGFPFNLHKLPDTNNPTELNELETKNTSVSIGFGCKTGKLSELKAILEVMNKNSNNG
jgi:hypothetical protein